MTTQEAIRQAERIVEAGKAFNARFPKHTVGWSDSEETVEMMDLLCQAARKGASEELQAEKDELFEIAKKLNVESVGAAIRVFDDCIREVQSGATVFRTADANFGLVIEPAMHTALAALEKVMGELVADIKPEDNPNVRVRTMNIDGALDPAKIAEQVKADLEQLFREAAEGKQEDKAE